MPETRTITQTVYTYQELDDQAKARVAEWLNDDTFQIEGDIELFTDPDPDYGNYPAYVLPTYHDVQLMSGKRRRVVDHYAEWGRPYHLSVGYVFDIPLFMRTHKIAGKYRAFYNAAVRGEVTAQVTQGSKWTGYHRDQYNFLDLDADYWDDAEAYAAQLDDVRDLLAQDMQTRIDTLSDQLRQECEYHWSDEYIAETCDANEYRFTEEGVPV